MKTGARLALERRFQQWSTGKSLSVLAAAVLLGVTLSAAHADAQSVCNDGYGGPSIAAVSVAALSGGPTVSVLINGAKVADLTADANGIVDLSGIYESGGTRFSIAGADLGFLPIAHVDQGSGVSLLVVTDLFITAESGAPATLTLVANSANALPTGCPGGTHTFAASMDGAVIAQNGAVTVTAEAFITDPASEGTKRIVVNRTPGDDVTAPSMSEVVTASQLLAEFFSDYVFENSQCGSLESFNCAFQLQNTIDLRFVNTGDVIYSAGSFKSAALEDAVENLPPGASGIGVLLGTTGVPFSKFNAAVATQPRLGTFEVGALIRLGTLSNGIDPVNEPFRLRVGAFTADLPTHSFVQRMFLGLKFYVFDGTLADGSRFKAVLTPLFGRQFSLVAIGRGADLTGSSTLVDLTVGGDSGGAAARVFSKW